MVLGSYQKAAVFKMPQPAVHLFVFIRYCTYNEAHYTQLKLRYKYFPVNNKNK